MSKLGEINSDLSLSMFLVMFFSTAKAENPCKYKIKKGIEVSRVYSMLVILINIIKNNYVLFTGNSLGDYYEDMLQSLYIY